MVFMFVVRPDRHDKKRFILAVTGINKHALFEVFL